MKANLSIDDLDEETVDGPAAGRDLLEYSGAFLLPFDRDADAFQLSLKADLKKMKRVRVTLVDPVTGASHLLVYGGVPLSTFLPEGILDTASAVIEVSLDSHHSVTIPNVDLDPSVEPIVVDTVDGKTLTGYIPYYFLAKSSKRMRR